MGFGTDQSLRSCKFAQPFQIPLAPTSETARLPGVPGPRAQEWAWTRSKESEWMDVFRTLFALWGGGLDWARLCFHRRWNLSPVKKSIRLRSEI